MTSDTMATDRSRRSGPAVVVIPTYNEAANVGNVLDRVLNLPAGLSAIIVDDASPDGTASVVKAIAEKYPERVSLIQRPAKSGLGTAYLTGFQAALQAGFELICEMDADLSHNPEDLPRLMVPIRNGEADLVVGTHGRGAWILDDLAAVQQLAQAMQEDLFVFPVEEATHWQSWNSDASAGQRTYMGENPEDGASINFFLAAKPVAAVKVRITDVSGELVRELQVSDAEAGVNRAGWDLRHTGPTPRQAGGQTGGGGGRFRGGMGAPVVPGNYTATVLVGDGDLQDGTTFQVRGDPRIELSTAGYQAWHDASQSLVDLSSQANQMMDQVAKLQDQLRNLKEQVRDAGVENRAAVGAQLDSAMAQLEELDNKLQRPPPRMGYRQYPRLNEEVGSLLRSVAGTQALPTEAQMTVLSELRSEAAALSRELDGIVAGAIRDLNGMLGDLPAVVVPRRELIP